MAGDRCVREDQIGASASSPETVICTTAAATLGPTGLRDTLRLFLRHEGSYTATADTLVMHKNSVKYRNNSAEKPSANPSEPTDSPSNAPSPHATGWVPPSCKNHRRGDPTMNGAVREQPAHLAAATSLPSPTSIHRLTQ